MGLLTMAGMGLGWWFWPLIIWSFFWKGLGLWASARNKQPWWFVAMLVLNTIGILPIIYLLVIDKGIIFNQFRDLVLGLARPVKKASVKASKKKPLRKKR